MSLAAATMGACIHQASPSVGDPHLLKSGTSSTLPRGPSFLALPFLLITRDLLCAYLRLLAPTCQ